MVNVYRLILFAIFLIAGSSAFADITPANMTFPTGPPASPAPTYWACSFYGNYASTAPDPASCVAATFTKMQVNGLPTNITGETIWYGSSYRTPVPVGNVVHSMPQYGTPPADMSPSILSPVVPGGTSGVCDLAANASGSKKKIELIFGYGVPYAEGTSPTASDLSKGIAFQDDSGKMFKQINGNFSVSSNNIPDILCSDSCQFVSDGAADYKVNSTPGANGYYQLSNNQGYMATGASCSTPYTSPTAPSTSAAPASGTPNTPAPGSGTNVSDNPNNIYNDGSAGTNTSGGAPTNGGTGVNPDGTSSGTSTGTGSFSGTCGAPPVCNGDAIACAAATSSFNTACALDTSKASAEKSLYEAAKDVTGSTIPALPSVNVGTLDQTELLGTAGSIQDLTVDVVGHSVVLKLSMLNVWLERLGYILMAVTALVCAKIIIRTDS